MADRLLFRYPQLFLIILLVIIGSCTFDNYDDSEIVNDKKPKNVILMIGDGMGLGHVSSIDFLDSSENNFNRFPVIGLINTSSASHEITDSAAGSTAFATGSKTYNGAIGVDSGARNLENIIEIISEEISTGIITTSSITHATPAAFYAHAKSRNMNEDIAKQLAYSSVDYFAGGGRKYFSSRADNINLVDTLMVEGFVIETIDTDFSNNIVDQSNKYGYLIAEDWLLTVNNGRGDFLPKATKHAIDYLSQNSPGFFLLIEAAQIDKGAHQNDSSYVVSEMLDFNKTIGIVMDFAQSNDNTIVIVTADHETGGMSLTSTGIEFSTTGHTSVRVPVFAYGPGSEVFSGIYSNFDVFLKIMETTQWYND